MQQPHNTAAAFAVHIEPDGAFMRVYLQRQPIGGAVFAKHRARRFTDPAGATTYADELAKTHGGLAVVYH